MLVKIKKNGILILKKFQIKCAIGKSGLKKNKREGDWATPKGIFSLDKLYYRADRIRKIETYLKCRKIKKHMGWCNNPDDKKYNTEFNLKSKKKGEKLFRKDYKYDLFIPINYNKKPVIPNKGSAIFIHLTRNYEPTAGCISLRLNDFLFILKFIKPNTRIKIA